MPESDQTPSTVVEVKDEKPSRFSLKSFPTNHPRITRVGTLIGFGIVVAGVTSVAKNMQQNKEHLALAAADAKEALHDLADAASTPDADA